MAVADLQRFQEILPTLKSALVILPSQPSVDYVSAGLALSLSLNKHGISTVVSSPNPMTVEFNRLVGVEQIRTDLGDKNLKISFGDYAAEDIERVAYNIENGQFALTVVPKPDKTAPKQDQILVNYSGVGADIILIFGANYPQDLGKFANLKEILEQSNLALVGNEPLSGWPKSIELIDTSRVSASEVVLDIIEQTGLSLDEDMATNIFLGLEDGSANFTKPTVSASTFAKAAELLEKGAKRNLPTQPQAPKFPRKINPQEAFGSDLQPNFRDSGNIG